MHKKGLIFGIAILSFMGISSAYAGPPMERVPLSNLSVLDLDDSMTMITDQQYTIRTDYLSNYPNTEYVILYQIKNQDNQVVSLSWLEGFQGKLSDNTGAYICGTDICFDEWHNSDPFVCGDKICKGKFYNQKFVETSWVPTEPGMYTITAFSWEAVNNPTALSPPIDIEVTVI